MKVFKEIKRRVHNMALAAMGRGAGWQEKLDPVNIKIGPPLKVETFAAEQFIGPHIDEFVMPETVMNFRRRELAAEIGRSLLDAGCIKEEISQRPHELGLEGHTLRLSVRVVVPDGWEADK